MAYPLYALAQVAELVDAQVSGTCGRKVVEVRVFSWAPSGLAGISAGNDDLPRVDWLPGAMLYIAMLYMGYAGK